jgi:hypothetical protein
MNLRNIVLGVVGLVVFGYVGVYAFMFMKVKGGVDDAAAQIALIGNFDYDGVSVSPLGSAFAVNNIRFAPHGSDDDISVDSLRIQIDNMLELMNLSRGVDPNFELPQQARISLEGLRIGMYSDWLSAFTELLEDQIETLGYRPELCGGHLMLQPEHYLEMGWGELVADIAVGYFHDVDHGRLDNDIEVALRDFGRIEYQIVTGAPTTSNLVAFAGISEPDLRASSLSYTDLGATAATNAFCAEADGISVEEYIEARIDQSEVDYLMTWGFVPGEGLRAAYKRFLRDPQSIELQVDPGIGFDPSTLHLYKASDIPQVLKLQVAVNGQPVEDLSFKTADEVEIPGEDASGVQYSLAAQLSSLTRSFSPEDRRAVDVPRPAPKEEPRFRRVSLKQLKQHVGREVKVVTTAGLTREGVLERVEGKTIYVVRIMRGGRFTMPVPYSQVKTVEALF